MSRKIRVAVVDDHPLFRQGVVHILSTRREIDVVAEGGTADDAIRIAREASPDVILLDVSMPGGGLAALKAICSNHPQIRCMMLTVEAAAVNVKSAMRIGAFGYILKGVSGDELVATVLSTTDGKRYVWPALAAQLLSDQDGEPSAAALPIERRSSLTCRERQILSLVSRGLSNKEIGSSLSLSDKTVKHHLSGVLRKLNVRNRVEAAVLGRAANIEASVRESDRGLFGPELRRDRL